MEDFDDYYEDDDDDYADDEVESLSVPSTGGSLLGSLGLSSPSVSSGGNGMVNFGEGLELNAKKFSNDRFAILGMSGSGKSYTGGKVMEELRRNGIGFVCWDVMGAHAKLQMTGVSHLEPDTETRLDIDDIIDKVLQNNLGVIINLSHLPPNEQQDYVGDYCNKILLKMGKLNGNIDKPIMTIFEEMQEFCPTRMNKPASMDVIRYVKQGRSLGLGTIMITQRPASISKEILSQCAGWFMHRLMNRRDTDAVKEQIDTVGKARVSTIINKLPTLETGVLIFWSPTYVPKPDDNYSVRTKVVGRLTEHAGKTIGDDGDVFERSTMTVDDGFDGAVASPSPISTYDGYSSFSGGYSGYDDDEDEDEDDDDRTLGGKNALLINENLLDRDIVTTVALTTLASVIGTYFAYKFFGVGFDKME